MNKFRVTVDGQAFDVVVEETESRSNSESSSKQKVISKHAPLLQPKTESAPQKEESNHKTSVVPTGKNIVVTAPMPGTILEVKVKAGDSVKAGDALLLLEAMKMENEITAAADGTVAEVLVKKGESVNSGDSLIIIS